MIDFHVNAFKLQFLHVILHQYFTSKSPNFQTFTLIMSASFHVLVMSFRAASSDGHCGNLKFGSQERRQPAFLAMSMAAR